MIKSDISTDTAPTTTKIAGQIIHTPTTKTCPKCIATGQGKPSCCAKGGSWHRKCGDPGDLKEYTWQEGLEACKGECVVFELRKIVTGVVPSFAIKIYALMRLR